MSPDRHTRKTPMTTQPRTKCDDAVFTKGRQIAFIIDASSTVIEAMIVRVREETKIPVDWHYVGCRAVVLVIGDSIDRDRVLHRLEACVPRIVAVSP